MGRRHKPPPVDARCYSPEEWNMCVGGSKIVEPMRIDDRGTSRLCRETIFGRIVGTLVHAYIHKYLYKYGIRLMHVSLDGFVLDSSSLLMASVTTEARCNRRASWGIVNPFRSTTQLHVIRYCALRQTSNVVEWIGKGCECIPLHVESSRIGFLIISEDIR